VQRSKAIVDVAQVIVNSAKVEVDLLNAIGGSEARSTFFGTEGDGERKSIPAQAANVRQIGSGR
jgi:hypothetical protein